MDDAEQKAGRGSTVEDSTGTSSIEVKEPRPAHVPERGEDEAEPQAEDEAEGVDRPDDEPEAEPQPEPEAELESEPEAEDEAVDAEESEADEDSDGADEPEEAQDADEADEPEAEPAEAAPVVDLVKKVCLVKRPRPSVTSDDAEADTDVSDEDDDEEAPARRRRRLPGWAELLALVAVGLTVVLCVHTFVAQPFVIPSGSMENTLEINDRVLVNKLAYRFSDPKRGDVIVFDGTGSFTPEGGSHGSSNPITGAFRKLGQVFGFVGSDETDFVKRVIGVGGDHVVCCDDQGRITVNGTALNESSYLYPGDEPSTDPFDVTVPAGKLWVMGDHRSNSADSRSHLGDPGGGFVPVSRVIGRVEWIIWPLNRIRSVDRPSTFDQPGLDRREPAGSSPPPAPATAVPTGPPGPATLAAGPVAGG